MRRGSLSAGLRRGDGSEAGAALDDRLRRERPDHRRPPAHAPARDDAVLHVGVRPGEGLRDGGRISLEQEHAAVDRIGQRAAEQQLAALDRGARQGQMFGAIRGAALDVSGTTS